MSISSLDHNQSFIQFIHSFLLLITYTIQFRLNNFNAFFCVIVLFFDSLHADSLFVDVLVALVLVLLFVVLVDLPFVNLELSTRKSKTSYLTITNNL